MSDILIRKIQFEGSFFKRYVPIFFLFITIFSIGLTVYVVAQNVALKKQLATCTSALTQSKQLIVENTKERESMVWVKQTPYAANDYFQLDVTSLLSTSSDELFCLEKKNGEPSVFSSEDFASLNQAYPNLLRYSKEIAAHQYSDERQVQNDKGQIIAVEHKGEKSGREIFYNSVCRSKTLYYFMYNTLPLKTGFFYQLKQKLGMAVKAAGGMREPSNFAYSTPDGTLVIMENFPPVNSHLTLPSVSSEKDRVEEYSGLTTTNSIAYYNCSNIYATNGSEVLVSCGGGDGPAGGSGVFLVTLKNQNTKEKAFCLGNPKYKKICFNEYGAVYKKIFNEETNRTP